MSDKNNDEIDLAKEIEELDEFLDDQDVDFPLDDDDSDYGVPEFASKKDLKKEKKAKKKAAAKGKASSGKFLGYLIFLCILFGGAYAAYLFAPRFIEKPQFERVQNFVSNESGDVVGDLTNIFKSYIPTSEKAVVQNEPRVPQETIDSTSNLPMPSDQELVDIDEALSIVGAIDFVRDTANTINEPTAAEKQADAIMSDLESSDLPALADERIETANDVMNMPKDDLIDIVEAIENVTAEKVVEIAKDRTPTAPKIEMPTVEIATKKVVPVKVVKMKKAEPKVSKPVDTRVGQAKLLFDNGDYNGSLNLYQAILKSDPANTSALTGRQLARAKLRMGGTSMRPVVPIEEKAQEVVMPKKSIPSVVVPTNSNISALLQQAQSNPTDAMMAFNVGNAYKGTDNAKAMEWYRKALQIDVMHSSNLDRMSVYDAMADIQ